MDPIKMYLYYELWNKIIILYYHYYYIGKSDANKSNYCYRIIIIIINLINECKLYKGFTKFKIIFDGVADGVSIELNNC